MLQVAGQVHVASCGTSSYCKLWDKFILQVVGQGCETSLQDESTGQVRGTDLWDELAEPYVERFEKKVIEQVCGASFGTNFRDSLGDKSAGQACWTSLGKFFATRLGTSLRDKPAGQARGISLRDKSVGQVCGTSLLDELAG
jgi:hypothetical protein